MINTFKLKGRMIEKKKTIQYLATKTSITAYTLGQQILNKKPMNLETAYILSEELDITDNEFADFFLQNTLQNATK